jgi:cell division protein FtsB
VTDVRQGPPSADPRRQAAVRRPARRPAASDKGRSRVGDATSPLAIDRRLATGKRTTLALGVAAVLIAGALGAALFAIPIRNYFAQDATLAQRASQLERLEAVNADLEAEVARLRTADGVREAAREELGFVEAGEQRTSVVDAGVVPTALPAGWPYSLVTKIVEVRRAAVAGAADTPAPAP